MREPFASNENSVPGEVLNRVPFNRHSTNSHVVPPTTWGVGTDAFTVDDMATGRTNVPSSAAEPTSTLRPDGSVATVRFTVR